MLVLVFVEGDQGRKVRFVIWTRERKLTVLEDTKDKNSVVMEEMRVKIKGCVGGS